MSANSQSDGISANLQCESKNGWFANSQCDGKMAGLGVFKIRVKQIVVKLQLN